FLSSTPAPHALVEKVRAGVLDKNFHWFNRYRTVDGYSIFGDRGNLKFVGGQTNRVVAERELEVLDVMTANRDKRIWALATGGDLKVDDSNTSPFLEVKTNKPGTGPNGEHLFLSGEEAIKKMTVAKGLKINLFASEKEFPELAKPVQIAFDPKGRLWVACMPSYPHWKPKDPMNDKIIILEDTDGDGKADKCTTFADKLHVPTGMEFFNGGLILAQQPDVVFLKDTDGDDKADVRERILHGLDSADTHHAINSFAMDPGGAIYMQEGTFHHTQVETPWGPPVRCANAGIYRYEPRSRKFEVYVTYPFANPHGHIFDRWGQDFATDGTGNVNYFAAAFSGHLDYPDKHSPMRSFFPQRSRPCAGTEVLSSRHFPAEFQGNYLIANVIGFQGIFNYRFKDDGSGFGAEEAEPIVFSSDPNFRPSDMETGPDGALYFSEWQNPIIGHMQHNLRDPSRDSIHGRVYRVTAEGRPLVKPPVIAGAPTPALLDLLKEPENRTRQRVRIELGARKPEEVQAALKEWLAKLDPKDPDFEHHRLEGLWAYQFQNVVETDLLKAVLASPEFKARAAAVRVLCYWRDRIPDALELLRKAANDPYPRVRLEAVRAASFFTVPEAIEVPLISMSHPGDYWLDYTRGETMRALDPHWKRALAEGRKIDVRSEAGAKFLLRNMPLEQLLKLDRDRAVCLELLYRSGVQDSDRRAALKTIAAFSNRPELVELLEVIRAVDDRRENRDDATVFDLVRMLSGRTTEELTAIRGDLEKLALTAKQAAIRQMGFVAILAVDENPDHAWKLALASPAALRDLLAAMPFISDPSRRAALYPLVEPLLSGLPAGMGGDTKGTLGRYVRIELYGKRRVLTLAEVEVFSDGKNVARGGRASQINVSNGGVAARAIDGNKSPIFGRGGQTHTEEATPDPWWEVDLGEELPLDSIAITNRAEGVLGNRLQGFTLKVLDGARNPVFVKSDLPAPDLSVDIALQGGGAAGAIRRAAMLALTSVRGQELKTFESLARFVASGADRLAAIRALQRIPRNFWPADKAKDLLPVLVEHVKKIPVKERTTPAALDALEFADGLASLLPPADARAMRRTLGDLGVRVIRVGTLPERMAYDKEMLVVQAGKPVEFILDNSDLMPHNFVITQPGAMAEIGELAEKTATDPAAAQRQFVPRSGKILLSSRLLQPRETQKLSFTAPKKPGVYPYVCTYPGHWRRMYGALYVVADLESYLAGPESYLAEHKFDIADELLKNNRPRTEWKFDDLADAVSKLSARNHGNGRQMFKVATCIACHKLEGQGNVFGPDLTKLEPKIYEPKELLKHMLDPSVKIDDKFQTSILQLSSGKQTTGLILEETPTVIKLVENPLISTASVEIKKEDVEARKKSPTSMMPKGLLDKLTKDEILDLMAYVIAKGEKAHPVFKGGGAHDHSHGGH
ncbi:MAG TPA: PVC-type heme-binding CxxCH protein, partial [Planctomycetia bacterium]|nr:PVC-type heme-binding CxxCH protein [Planctomycetia bacterium]